MVDVWAGATIGTTTVVGTRVGTTVDETKTEDLLSVTVLKPVLYSVTWVVDVAVLTGYAQTTLVVTVEEVLVDEALTIVLTMVLDTIEETGGVKPGTAVLPVQA